jgi:hypothetical protein
LFVLRDNKRHRSEPAGLVGIAIVFTVPTPAETGYLGYHSDCRPLKKRRVPNLDAEPQARFRLI